MKSIQVSEDILPIGELKAQFSRVLRKLREAQRPIVITQNGKPAAVLITPEEFDRFREHDRFLEAGEGENMAQEKERCYFCRQGTLESRRVTVDLRRGDRLIVVKNVPALMCNACGERQYSLDVSREIDRLLDEIERTGQGEEEIRVPVVSMA